MLSSVSFRRCKGTATFGLFQKIRRNLLGVVATASDSCDKAAANSLNVVAKKGKWGEEIEGMFDELLFEQRGNVCWLHFAVRPPSQQNRRKISFIKV